MKNRIGLLVLLMGLSVIHQTEAELYADFVTPKGAFSVQLSVLDSPRAVANFMGLVSGVQTWRDPVMGVVYGGQEEEAASFYQGMCFYATEGSRVLLGGLRSYIGTDGYEYWEGPGYTILDEVDNGIRLAYGTLVMPEFNGPHSGGGELGIILTNQVGYVGSGWTAFGVVQAMDMPVVEAVAAEINAGSRIAVEIMIRDEFSTPEERAALAAAKMELPVLVAMPLELNMEGERGISFQMSSHSQACLAATPGLVTNRWQVLPGMWELGESPTSMKVPFASIPGLAEHQGFISGSEAVYPKMTAKWFPEKMRLAVEHTGVHMQYWLDFTAGTGIWARVENGIPVENGVLSSLTQSIETANSLRIVFVIGMTAYYYWLGMDEQGAQLGRFYNQQWYWNAELVGEDNGMFEYAEGWGDTNARIPRVRTCGVTPLFRHPDWAPASREKTRMGKPILPLGGLDLISEGKNQTE
ncbi:MAG: peptidylprolyl isomerase [Verrucomicrobiota bacterium]|jgi:peptidyl-prolyl cis-trans isomerase A (cyclophilin A)|nr:peptidylprolyl isomerase [Verrucomicrobiota bacterium]